MVIEAGQRPLRALLNQMLLRLLMEERHMIPFYDAMDLFADLVERLTRPNHGITSMSQLCKMERIPDDLARRNVAKLEERFRGRLIQVENHRLSLSERGHRVRKLALQERAVAEVGEDGG